MVFKNRRLGKLVEEFVFHQLKTQPAVSWICDNLQVRNGKITVGEIDALYQQDDHPIHLEVAYKFYLYDTVEQHSEPLARWIGPNRKDNLFYKLGKMRDKQFPLLHNPLTKFYLDGHGLRANAIAQKLCFRGQLFLPYGAGKMDIRPLNNDCIAGFHFPFQRMNMFEDATFYIPAKLDWLVVPHQNVAWINYTEALDTIRKVIADERSPLVWMKLADGELVKGFVTFW